MLTRALLALAVTAGPAAAFEVGLPIDCTPGTDCFVQNYVDREEGPGVRDYACGAATYDGHEGTDIRVRSTADVAKSVAVLASAPGTVVGVRDGMEDHLVRGQADRAAVKDRECGNGVRIDHGGGWFTQYCHMRQGSVAVEPGDRVEAGSKLGEVGYSGEAAFPHVHLQVTKDDQVLDPFLADTKAACGADGLSLWSTAAKTALSYRPGIVLALGLTNGPVALEQLETGAALPSPSRDTPAVAYIWAINLQKGDTVTIALKTGETVLVEDSQTLDRNKAQIMLFAGKKPPAGGWPEGPYAASVSVTRDGKTAIDQTTKPLELN